MKIRRTSEAGGRQGGFSIVESLIAAAIIGIVAIGVLPLFTRAIVDNVAGADYTRVTNYAKSKEEDFSRIPYLQPTIQVQPGQTNLMTTEYMDPASLYWVATKPPNPLAVWTRLTTFTEYNLYDTDDDKMFDNPLDPGAVGIDAIMVIQAQVQVKSVSAIGPLGGRRTTLVRYLKVF
ncbi:MAG TPA: prepilin-type N-terminal cleavage/methylation domain-containing protein [Thermoanaerobaculia bacterium]|jgi:prepilin-type N-terminal cleavage/methylation domain-containing protein|nr:prepilin-type N-terminal cleavage/methylation domain-containing protein [Thermoanaerobaculia bacterium]